MQIGFSGCSLLRTLIFFPTKNHFSPHIFCSVLAPDDYGEVFNSIESLSAQWRRLFTKLRVCIGQDPAKPPQG